MSSLSPPSSRARLVLLIAVGLVASGCFKSTPQEEEVLEKAAPVQSSPPLPAGNYDIQTIAYDDANGAFRLFVLGVPAGHKPLYTTTDLQLARLGAPTNVDGDAATPTADEAATAAPAPEALPTPTVDTGAVETASTKADVAAAAVPVAGAEAANVDTEKADANADGAAPAPAVAPRANATRTAYLESKADGSVVAWLPEDFAIQYTHNVVEDRGGQPVVVRTERSTWSPFMSAMAGVAVGNMLFGPRHYYPPPYVSGRLVGYGGVGTSKVLAQQSFQKSHGSLPQAARLSTSGYSKAPSSSKLKSTGKGVGSSRLKQPAFNKKTTKPPRRSFGRGFGRRR